MSGLQYAPTTLLPGKNPRTHWIGGRVGPRASVNCFWRRENILPMPGFEPWTIQLLASRCTDYAVLAFRQLVAFLKLLTGIWKYSQMIYYIVLYII